MTLPGEILEEAQRLFDDVRITSIDPEKHTDFIIARVIDRGTLRSVRALCNRYGLDRIRRFFLDGGGEGLSRRSVPLWTAYLGLRPEACIPRSSPRRRPLSWNG